MGIRIGDIDIKKPIVQSGVDINDYYDLTKRTDGSITKYIKQIPLIDTSSYTSTYIMFNNYSSLTTIPLLDTSNVTNMSSMFGGCSNLISIPQLDTSKVTNMNNMFSECTSLTSIPLLDTSNVTDMSYMFADCRNLTTIPQLDTSKVTRMNAMFYNTSNLTTVPQLNASSVNYISGIFTNLRNILNIGGFKDLGKGYDTTKSANYSDYRLELSRLEQLTEQSIINVLNNLYDIASLGVETQTVQLGSTNLAKLTSEEGQAALTNAQAKGWTVV